MNDDDTPVLTCAACGALMRPDEALPAPEEGPHYHTSILTCWQHLDARPVCVSQWSPIARTA